MLKIYGSVVSVPTNKVRFAANKLGLDYEFIMVNLAEGEHMTERFLKLNPVGKVPVIDDGGFTLFESNAISKYLSEKNRSSLYPQDLRLRANIDKWIDFTSLHVATALTRVFFNRVLAPFVNVEVDERSISDGLVFLERFLPVVDNQLKENRFLAGEGLTLADLNLLAALDPAEAAQVDLSPYPDLSRWREGLRQEEFYTRCHSSFEEALQSLGN
ncbi:MAG: glutathione S-transferase family protein [Deltaproteobacteria bacterium]